MSYPSVLSDLNITDGKTIVNHLKRKRYIVCKFSLNATIYCKNKSFKPNNQTDCADHLFKTLHIVVIIV